MPIELLGRMPVEPFAAGAPRDDKEPLELCKVTEGKDIVSQQFEWDQAARPMQSGVVQFDWPAILDFHPQATTFMLRADEQAQAMLQLREDHVVRCAAGHRGPLHYVSFLEVAPWNRAEARGRRFKGLGLFMLRVVAARALLQKPVARIGLHSLATAASFYNGAGFVPHHCPNEFRELYFEADEQVVHRLMHSNEARS